MISVTFAKSMASAVFVAVILVSLASGCKSERSTTAGSPGPPVVIAAGDIARCDSQGDESTAKLLGSTKGTILTLGDNVYENGTLKEFANCYGPTWGRFKARTKPVLGNHEYHTAGASGYFDYFGRVAGRKGKGYYSFDLGRWHLIALNSNCQEIGGCKASSPQVRWLKHDLADNRSKCTLAYFHYPLFSSGKYRPGISEMKAVWEVLYSAGADVVLNGHDHNYERFAPQNPEGGADLERGIREFVVGTGGGVLYPIESPLSHVQSYNDDTYGVLKVTLLPDGYEWRFLAAQGSTFADSGKARCH
jgi:acid phosphatase type 7